MELMILSVVELAVEIIVFLVLLFIFEFIVNKIKNSSNKSLKLSEYFPDEEIHSLRQIYFLIIMGLLFINVLYTFVFNPGDLIYLAIYDIVLSLYMASTLDKSSLKNKILLVLLIPYGSLTFILFGSSLVGLVDFIHIPVFVYFIKVYFDKFMEYTQSNGLGLTVILLFAIVFISFFTTQIVEGVNPLDALVMVSNAFTSNGYAVLGTSIPGKINAIILVWGGYLISGVATATLTSAILIRHFNSKFEEMEELIKNNERE